MIWDVLRLGLQAIPRGRKGLEVQALVIMVIVVVFLLVAIMALVVMFKSGNIFSGDNTICDQTGGLFRGCD